MALVNGLPPERSADLYEAIAGILRARGLVVDVIHGLENAAQSFRACDVVFSNSVLPSRAADGGRVYAGTSMSRPASLRMLEHAGVATMDWALAGTRRDVRALFARWNVDYMLLKPSFTYGGRHVRVFRRHAIWRLRWARDLDVFCREINPDDGDVYKVELLGGRVLIAWQSASPPIRARLRRGLLRGLAGAYGERTLWDPPPALAACLTTLSRRLTARRVGHVSVDLMLRPDGEPVAIELNLSRVATWWTSQFPAFRERYADALHGLAFDAPDGLLPEAAGTE